MFESVGNESRFSRMIPGLVIGGAVIGLVVVLVQVNMLPGEILLVVFGPGFLVGSVLFPAGVHSDSPALFVLIGIVSTAAWWWGVSRLFVKVLRRIRKGRQGYTE